MSDTAMIESGHQVEVDDPCDVDEFEDENLENEDNPSLRPVESLRDEQTQLEAWVHQSFAALERLHSELDEWQRELTRQQADLDATLSNGHDSSEQVQELEKNRDRIEQQRDQALRKVSELEKALAQSQASLVENNHSQNDSSERLEQLQERYDQVAQQLAQALQEVRQREEENAEQVQDMDALERQLTAIRAELKAVREHADQLSHSLDSERQRAMEQQKHWTGELKELRHLLGRQCELMVRGSVDGTSQEPHEPERKVEPEKILEIPAMAMEAELDVLPSGSLEPETRRSDEIRRLAKDRRAAKRRKRKQPES